MSIKRMNQVNQSRPWATAEGVFPTPDGQFIASVKLDKKQNNVFFKTLFKNKDKELVEKYLEDYKNGKIK